MPQAIETSHLTMLDDFLVEYVHGRHDAREYFDRVVDGRGFEEACRGVVGMAVRCRAHLRAALQDLDGLPRSDPFWLGTNMRTTFTKLARYHGQLRTADFVDGAAAWKTLAVALWFGHRRMYIRACKALHRYEGVEVHWLIRTSMNMAAISGAQTVNVAARLIGTFGLADAASDVLDHLKRSASQSEASWAARVLRRLTSLGAG